MIETDYSTYRVEEFFEGKPFLHYHLGEKETYTKIAHLICDFNYDPDLIKLTENSKIKMLEIVSDAKGSWHG
jgi:hypothetical protein